MILILLRFGRTLVRSLWPLLLVIFLNRGNKIEYWIGIATACVALISLLGSVIAYFRFYYHVDQDQLHISKGLVRRSSIDIPFARIQTVDFEQNVVHQAFKVVRVNIDSAGSKSEEISFDALTVEDARLLRDFIMEQKAESAPEEAAVIAREEPEELILHLTPRDLLKIGISQNHLRTAGIVFAAIWALADNIDQALQLDLYERMSQEIGTLVTGSILIITYCNSTFPYYFIYYHPVPHHSQVFRPAIHENQHPLQTCKRLAQQEGEECAKRQDPDHLLELKSNKAHIRDLPFTALPGIECRGNRREVIRSARLLPGTSGPYDSRDHPGCSRCCI